MNENIHPLQFSVSCECVLEYIQHIKDALDRPLRDYTQEILHHIIEQLHALRQIVQRLPPTSLQEICSSPELFFQRLQETMVAYSLTFDVISSEGKTARYYQQLISAQLASQDLLSSLDKEMHPLHAEETQKSEPMDQIINISAKPSERVPLSWTSSREILSRISQLFQQTEIIEPPSCEQAIEDLRKLSAFLETHKHLTSHADSLLEPSEILEKRYRLQISLARAIELIQKLITLLSTFHAQLHSKSKRTLSKRALKNRQDICTYLALLDRPHSDIFHLVQEISQ